MTKRQLIDEIITLNETAKPVFLARFGEPDLQAYREHLLVARKPRLWGDPTRYDKYFVTCLASTGKIASVPPPMHQDNDPSVASRYEAAGDPLPQEQPETTPAAGEPVPVTLFEAQASTEAAGDETPSAADVAGQDVPLAPETAASDETAQAPDLPAVAVVEESVQEQPVEEPLPEPVALEPSAAPLPAEAATSDEPEVQGSDEPVLPEPENTEPDDEQADEAQQQILTPSRKYYSFLPSYRSSEAEDQDDQQEPEDSQLEPQDTLAEEPADSDESPQPVTAGVPQARQEPAAEGSDSWLF